jgi:hypothetical protein
MSCWRWKRLSADGETLLRLRVERMAGVRVSFEVVGVVLGELRPPDDQDQGIKG